MIRNILDNFKELDAKAKAGEEKGKEGGGGSALTAPLAPPPPGSGEGELVLTRPYPGRAESQRSHGILVLAPPPSGSATSGSRSQRFCGESGEEGGGTSGV